jgi:3-isopropylmalate dehydrogenase
MTTKKKFSIAVLPGDGIGPEIMAEAIKVLRLVEKKYPLSFSFTEGLIGGIAIDRLGSALPEETRTLCRQSDAILMGSIGGPKWDQLPPKQRPELAGLLAIRSMLKLYANLRPIVLFKELAEISPLFSRVLNGNLDLLTVRELASGIYFGTPKTLNDEEGVDTMRYRRPEVVRIAKAAFEIAQKRSKKVVSVDKANVLYSSMLWRDTVKQVAANYPDVELQHMYVDNAAMQLILNPRQFDVILTTNMFGDILSDESAAIAGSLGMLPSASLGEKIHLYEPAGGSAPDIAGKGIANPIAQILSAAMMLEYSFAESQAAKDIYQAVEKTIKKGLRTKDIATGSIQPISTSAMGDAICQALADW